MYDVMHYILLYYTYLSISYKSYWARFG